MEKDTKKEEAISVYQKAIEIKPDNSRVQAKLARILT